MTNQRVRLTEIMDATTKWLNADLARVRAAFSHAATKGHATEEIVREFLDSNLPDSIGVVTGQVLDSHGSISREVDVILYDRARTSMLFTSTHGGHALVPVEGVFAAVEVKTKLTRQMLPEIRQNCESVKKLDKRAYFGTPPTQKRYRCFGQEWTVPPIYFAVFSFESYGACADDLNVLHRGVPPHERIDLVVSLDRGTAINTRLDPNTLRSTFHATPDADTVLTNGPEKNALLHWHSFLVSHVTQVEADPINLAMYLGDDERRIQTTIGASHEALTRPALEAQATALGITLATATRLIQGTATTEDAYHLFRSPNAVLRNSSDDETANVRMQQLVDQARSMSLESWIATAPFSGDDDRATVLSRFSFEQPKER